MDLKNSFFSKVENFNLSEISYFFLIVLPSLSITITSDSVSKILSSAIIFTFLQVFKSFLLWQLASEKVSSLVVLNLFISNATIILKLNLCEKIAIIDEQTLVIKLVLSPVKNEAKKVRELTDKPFGIDLLSPVPDQLEKGVDAIIESGASSFIAGLGVPFPIID